VVGSQWVVTSAGDARPAETAPPPGVTRFDVLNQPQVVQTVLGLMRRWAEDRALSDVARVRLAALVRATMGHGLRFGPRALTVLIGWVDPDRVRLEVRWIGCSTIASGNLSGHDVGATISTLDTLADGWGFGSGRSGWVHWMVVDTR
jgi:hypothetical protein